MYMHIHKLIYFMTMTERAKLLGDNASVGSTESDGEDTKIAESAPIKDDPATLIPEAEELKHVTSDQSAQGQPELPPPYEPGNTTT